MNFLQKRQKYLLDFVLQGNVSLRTSTVAVTSLGGKSPKGVDTVFANAPSSPVTVALAAPKFCTESVNGKTMYTKYKRKNLF